MITLEDIKNEIISEINLLKNTPYNHHPTYKTCKKYLQNNRFTKPEHFKDIDIWECVKCLYILKSKSNKSIEEIDSLFNTFKLCFKNADSNIFFLLTTFIFKIPNSKEEKLIYSYINEKNRFKATFLLTELYKIYDLRDLLTLQINYENIEDLLITLRNIQLNGYDIISIIKLLNENIDLMTALCSFIFIYKKINEDYNKLDKIVFDKKSFTLYNSLPLFVSEEDKKEREFEKNKELTIEYYNKVIDKLTNESTKPEITNAREIIRLIRNENIKRLVLKFIYYHNKAYYDKLQEEKQKIDNNGILAYQNLLMKYKIEIDINEIAYINHNSLDDIETILILLPKIFDNLEIIQILKYTNLEIVQKIKKYYDLGLFNDNYLQTNLDLFDKDSNKLNKYELSFNILNEKGINPLLFQYNPNILIENPIILEHNLSYLTDYGLIIYLKSTDNHSFLLEEDLVEKIDYIIELGLYSFLERDLEILNIPLMILKRIELLNALDMPIENIEDFWSIIESEEFIVPDELIDSYISNVAPLMPKLDLSLEILNSIKSDNINLVLGQTTFSLPKVKRKLAEGLTLQDALFYNKNVSLSTYHDITSIFKGITK